MPVIMRRDSRGNTHRVHYIGGVDSSLQRIFGRDSVQVTKNHQFKMGDLVRPTKEYIEQCCNGSVPYEMVQNWHTGFKIVEIGPEIGGMPGVHPIELEDCDSIFIDSEGIEKI